MTGFVPVCSYSPLIFCGQRACRGTPIAMACVVLCGDRDRWRRAAKGYAHASRFSAAATVELMRCGVEGLPPSHHLGVANHHQTMAVITSYQPTPEG